MPAEVPSVSPTAVDLPVDEGPPLAKSDRLPSPGIDRLAVKPTDDVASPKMPEATVTPSRIDNLRQNKPAANEVTTWHWHRGSKVTKQTTIVEPKRPTVQ